MERAQKVSQEGRAKISARVKGNTFALGFKHSPESRARMGAGKIGLKYPPRSELHRLKISLAKKGQIRNIGRIVSAETREKLRKANLGKAISIEVRKKACTLTADQVRAIREMRRSGMSYRAISDETGTKRQLVGKVCLRQRYEWVDPSEPIAKPSTKITWKHSAQSIQRHSEAGKKRWAERKASGKPNPKHKSPRNFEQRASIAVAARKAWDLRRQKGSTNRASPTAEQRENYRAAAKRAWDVRRANGKTKVSTPRTEEQKSNYRAAAIRRHQRARESHLNL